MPICHFLLVFHCNYIHRFCDIKMYLSKINWFFDVFTHPVSFEALARGVPIGPRYADWRQKTSVLMATAAPKVISFHELPAYNGQTNAETGCLRMAKSHTRLQSYENLLHSE